MRIYEFDDAVSIGHEYAVRVKLALENLIGRSSSKNQAANYNWEFLNNLPELKGLKITQSVFAKLYDTYPMIKGLVRNFDTTGVNLKVPGVNPERQEPGSDIDKSKDNVNQTAAANAYKQMTA